MKTYTRAELREYHAWLSAELLSLHRGDPLPEGVVDRASEIDRIQREIVWTLYKLSTEEST